MKLRMFFVLVLATLFVLSLYAGDGKTVQSNTTTTKTCSMDQSQCTMHCTGAMASTCKMTTKTSDKASCCPYATKGAKASMKMKASKKTLAKAAVKTTNKDIIKVVDNSNGTK